MGIENRFRGKTKLDSAIIGSVPQNQIESLSSSPLAAPTISFDGYTDTAGGAPVFTFTVTMNRNQTDDTGTSAVSKRAVMDYWFETTAAALLDGAVLAGAAAANTSGLTAVGLVIPNSTVAGGYHVGKLVCSSTGQVTAGFTGTSGGGTTGVFTVMLPNGTIAQSSQVALSTA